MDIRQRIQKRAFDSALKTVGRLRERRDVVGRAVRALDEELSLEYLAARLRLEDQLIDRFVAQRPASSERVSIVVPVFGIPVAYLDELVSSIRQQTYKNWEVCFCDDGENDDKVKRYLQKLSAESSRFKVARHDTNLGIATATRTALGLATGSLVAFADEDDLVHPRALEVVVAAFAEDANVEFVYTDNDHATDLGHRRAPLRKPGWSPELLQCVNYVNHLAVARRTFLDRSPGLFEASTSGGQDWELSLRAAENARAVAHVPLPVYHWRKRPGSIAAALGAKPWVRDACVRVRKKHLKSIDPRLTLAPADARAQHRHHLEPDLEHDAEPPSVAIVVLNAASPGEHRRYLTDYRGWQRVVHLDTSGLREGGALIRWLRGVFAELNSEQVLVTDAGKALPAGSLSRLVAYALQPSVGCVWPFKDEDRRLCYTVGQEADLTPLSDQASIFSRFSGNVLTGPLHGLLARREVLAAALSEIEKLTPFVALEEPHRLDTLGAAIGLGARQAGYRNVACRGMRCDTVLPNVGAPREWLPSRDPYV